MRSNSRKLVWGRRQVVELSRTSKTFQLKEVNTKKSGGEGKSKVKLTTPVRNQTVHWRQIQKEYQNGGTMSLQVQGIQTSSPP
ncbi:unnamed protein product [Linum trigynum]|uniref:Uncharacterized protein n=1 Tax=Linum trigynum TaxID=586398 RepID=A0AAV2F6Y8_9ROSI